MDLLPEIDTYFYEPFMTTDKKGEKVIILQCMNDLYGTIVDILVYWNKFVKILKSTGFQLNPYYPCVSNRLVKDK